MSDEEDRDRMPLSLADPAYRASLPAAITETTLTALKPPQVGTSIATNKSFQRNFYAAGNPKRTIWAAVKKWLYAQRGRCVDCGTVLALQGDHIESRKDKLEEADYIENMTLRCRRHNSGRDRTQGRAGAFLTKNAALMYLLLVRRPSTFAEYWELARNYFPNDDEGKSTIGVIQVEEAWARAIWLEREGKFEIVTPAAAETDVVDAAMAETAIIEAEVIGDGEIAVEEE
jgi:5-methylcytosine-specific restriction endonuclease McrA